MKRITVPMVDALRSATVCTLLVVPVLDSF